MNNYRQETRRQRYNKKLNTAQMMPISVACVNLNKEANVCFITRAAACFGAEEMICIGSTPNRDRMNDLSGSTYDYVKFRRFSTTSDFMRYCEKNNLNLISLEPPGEYNSSVSLHDFKFDFSKRNIICVGGETVGLTADVVLKSQCVYIPMPSIGHCLNVSQAATIALFEASKQYAEKIK